MKTMNEKIEILLKGLKLKKKNNLQGLKINTKTYKNQN